MPETTVTRESDGACWTVDRPAWTQAGWFAADLDPRVRALIDLPLGVELISALDGIGPMGSRCPHPHVEDWAGGDPVGIPGNPCACQIIVAAAWGAVASWTSQTATDRLLDAAGAVPTKVHHVPEQGRRVTITDPALIDLAAGLRMAPGSLRSRLANLRYRAAVPQLAEAVRDGTLDSWPAALLFQDTDNLAAEEQHLVLELLLATVRARHDQGLVPWTLPRIRQEATRICASLDLDLQAAREQAKDGRKVTLRTHGQAPGMAALIADLPADVAQRIWQRLTAITEALANDEQQAGCKTRTRDQIRADVFADLLVDNPAPATTTPVEAGGEVAVVISADVLLRGDDRAGHIPGIGPVPADVARELAADRRWRLWITNPANGEVVATSPGTYRPTAALARLVRARDPHCRMPGCQRPSSRCQFDHAVDFPDGPTTAANLGPLCQRDHNLKTHHGWRIDVHDDGTYTWASPTGITYKDRSDPPLPDPPYDDW